MKDEEITDRVIEAMRRGDHRFIRLNYPNGDMVGHTGVFYAAVIAVEAADRDRNRMDEKSNTKPAGKIPLELRAKTGTRRRPRRVSVIRLCERSCHSQVQTMGRT